MAPRPPGTSRTRCLGPPSDGARQPPGLAAPKGVTRRSAAPAAEGGCATQPDEAQRSVSAQQDGRRVPGSAQRVPVSAQQDGATWGVPGGLPPGKHCGHRRSRQNVGEDGATPGGYGGKPPGVAFIGVPTGARNAGRCSDGGPEHRYACYTETPPCASRPDYEQITSWCCFPNHGAVLSAPWTGVSTRAAVVAPSCDGWAPYPSLGYWSSPEPGVPWPASPPVLWPAPGVPSPDSGPGGWWRTGRFGS